MALLDSIIDEIPKNISQGILEAYPDADKRNSLSDEAILSALTEMLRQQKKQKLLNILDDLKNNPPCQPQEQSSVDMVRELRETEIDKLMDI